MKFSPSSFECYQVGKVGRGSAHELSVTPNGLHPLIAAIIKGLPRIWFQVVPAARTTALEYNNFQLIMELIKWRH